MRIFISFSLKSFIFCFKRSLYLVASKMLVSRLYSGWSSAGGLGDLTASLTLLLFNVIFLLGSITDAA